MKAAFMSTIDDEHDETAAFYRKLVPIIARADESAIVPKDSITGRALIAVVAIMSFLAALTTGATMLVLGAASSWQSDVSRELTVQIRPGATADIEGTVKKAAAFLAGNPAVADIRVYSKEESARLLEPWLGSNLPLDVLPVPRIIAVRLGTADADIAAMRTALAKEVAGATLDDHRGWLDRMRAMTRTAVATGMLVLMLVLAAMVLSVSFATRGAMATNRPIIEVLHFIGARDGFIAGQFQRQFLILGLQGGLIGGGGAALVFLIGGFFSAAARGTPAGDQTAALFGSFSIGALGYFAIVALIALAALVTAATSRYVVGRTLRMME
jgi:cell division transport system permease protein